MSSAVVLALGSVAMGAIGDPPSWDVVDLDFGSGKANFQGFEFSAGEAGEILQFRTASERSTASLVVRFLVR